MDGGIGESALMGALISGGVGLATGKNPLTAALLGGLTGGAMSGITGALGTAGADTAQGAVQAADATSAAANAGITPLPDTSSLYWSPASDVSAVNTADITNTGATSMMESPSLGASNGYVPGSGTESTQTLGQYANAQSQTPAANLVQTADGRYIDPTAYGSTATQNVATKAAADAATKPQGILGSLKQTWNGLSMPEKVGVGIAGTYGINQLMKPPTMIDPNIGKSSYSGPKLHDLSPNFKGTDVPQPQPYYTASYAEGGIADLASGGQMAPQQANVDFMGGDMYPQSQQQRSFYATPTQMPTSAQQATASYEPNTNPLTGEPTVGMAAGGIAGYAAGGTPDTGGQVYYDSATGKYYTQTNPGGFMNMGPDSIFSTMFGGFANDPAMNSNDPTSPFWNGRTYLGGSPTGAGEFQASQVTPEVYQQPTYASQPTTTAVSSTIPSYALADSMPLLQASNPELAARMSTPAKGMAAGGIAGYSLGGYADGGIPHLLKGPGDGMSDSIPATIGSKQPARLATGEFVVPADVVSHLGNGSTDAGAKHLYAMMDKVRTARTGRKSQGKQINASNYLPA